MTRARWRSTSRQGARVPDRSDGTVSSKKLTSRRLTPLQLAERSGKREEAPERWPHHTRSSAFARLEVRWLTQTLTVRHV
jgi:hypothetical protein